MLARYLVEVQGADVYINTNALKEDLGMKPAQPRKSIDEEQMLDIAELCFVRIADVLIKKGQTVREVFGKFAQPDVLPDRATVLELISPVAFLEATKSELGFKDFSEIEVACLMRVLSKPELENGIILNEFALIMENFGVPLLDGPTLSEEEDYTPAGADKPSTYDLKQIDSAGADLLRQVARYLLKEYLHPREFFGKAIKNNQEVKVGEKTYKVDLLKVKDFYLKIKIANIRKTLDQNESINAQLCLDPQTHPDVFNVKLFVRALEDIAEEEQEKLFLEEQAEEESKKLLSEESKQEEAPPKSPKDQDYKDSSSSKVVKSEAVKFGRGSSKAGRSPHLSSKFHPLGTIEEAQSETTTQ